MHIFAILVRQKYTLKGLQLWRVPKHYSRYNSWNCADFSSHNWQVIQQTHQWLCKLVLHCYPSRVWWTLQRWNTRRLMLSAHVLVLVSCVVYITCCVFQKIPPPPQLASTLSEAMNLRLPVIIRLWWCIYRTVFFTKTEWAAHRSFVGTPKGFAHM